jgi:tetratricopeptide (TPR) repeat protein
MRDLGCGGDAFRLISSGEMIVCSTTRLCRFVKKAARLFLSVMFGQARTGTVWLLLLAWAAGAGAQAPQSDAAAVELQQHYDTAQRYQQSGDLDQAAREYRLFLAQALDELALGEAHLRRNAEAARVFQQAIALDPDLPAAYLDDAQAQLDAGSFAQAEALARHALQIPGTDTHETARAHEILGRALLRMNRDQEAKKELEGAAAAEPSFDHSYNLAIACLDLDDASCATQIFSSMESTYGDTPGIHMAFGRAWGQSDFQPRAVAEFRKAIEEDPKLPSAHYCLAATYLQENASDNLKEAESELRKELAISPDDYLTWAALGKLAAIEQNFAEAEADLRRAIRLNPRDPDAYLYLGQMDFNLNRWSDSASALRRAIALTEDPSHNRYQIQKAHYLLGRILMRQGQEKEAAAEMKIAQSFLQSNLSQDRSKLSGLFGNTSPADDKPGAGLALGADSESPAVDPKQAARVEAFRRQITEPVADSYNNLGDIAATRNNFAAAAAYFAQAASWNPSMEGIDLNWGRAAFSAGQYGDAIQPLTRYVRAHPAEHGIRAPLAISEYMTGDYSGCVAILQRAGNDLTSVPQVAFVYADSLVKTGHVGTGVDMLRALEEKDPGIADVHRALGEAYATAAQKQKSLEELRTAIRLNPQDQHAKDDLERVLLGGKIAPASPRAAGATGDNPH